VIALLAYIAAGMIDRRQEGPETYNVTVTPLPTPSITPTPTLAPTPTPEPQPYDGISVGFASARWVMSPFPDSRYWYSVARDASDKFSGSDKQCVWVIGGVLQGGICYLNFPCSKKYDYVTFSGTDENEDYLDYFDQNGVSVILQIEPGLADVDQVIKLVMDRYSHHPCVIGFGIDAEWLGAPNSWNGRQVTDEEAERWYGLINTYSGRSTAASSPWSYPSGTQDKTYVLALTHWMTGHMPPTYREGLLFLYDGFGFSSIYEMKNKCIQWGEAYPDNPVGFYIGFAPDQTWWGTYDDPYYRVAQTVLDNVPNAKSIYWVPFTITSIYPT
jgi:hypothetical protein